MVITSKTSLYLPYTTVRLFETIGGRTSSTGDQWTDIQLDDAGATLIVGSIGVGITMLDALCFALFNKPLER